jgi:hypothetical protein
MVADAIRHAVSLTNPGAVPLLRAVAKRQRDPLFSKHDANCNDRAQVVLRGWFATRQRRRRGARHGLCLGIPDIDSVTYV